MNRGFIKRKSQQALIEKYRMVGESEAFLDCMEQVSRAGRVNRPVLVIGERGTGKELVAARLHYLSPRWQASRVAINCAAFSPDLLESEIFGYEPGAFTGATRLKPGRFELADGGTLFLDELAQSSRQFQEKLLRVLEYGEFERVGGVKTIDVDVRVVAATNQDMPTLCRQGRFREDLLDRLSFEVITIPPLRERTEDIPLMVHYFSMRMARELEMDEPPIFSDLAMEEMLTYSWPGNVRELKNVVERAVYRNEDDIIDSVVFDPFESPYRLTGKAATKNVEKEPDEKIGLETERPVEKDALFHDHEDPYVRSGNLQDAVEDLERKMIQKALKSSKFNQKKAAECLGLGYHQFRRYLKKYDIPT